MGDSPGLVAVEPCEAGGGLQPGPVTQDGHRARQRRSPPGDAGDPPHDAVPERGDGDLVEREVPRAGAVERNGAQQLLEVERVPRRGLMRGSAGRVVRVGNPAAHDPGHRFAAKRLQALAYSAGRRQQRLEHVRRRVRLVRPHGDD